MANSKNRCTGCGKYFPPGSMIKVPAGNFHDHECLREYGIKKTNKLIKSAKVAKKKTNAKQKRDFYANDLSTRKAAAKKFCHRYINLRDKGLACICCGRPLNRRTHAGHFLEAGNNPRIRYDEDNINSQLDYCNLYQGGDSDDYRGNLIKKIGLDKVERLEGLKGGTVKRTCEDYREIEQYYKDKIKLINN